MSTDDLLFDLANRDPHEVVPERTSARWAPASAPTRDPGQLDVAFKRADRARKLHRLRDEYLHDFYSFVKGCLGKAKLTDGFHKPLCETVVTPPAPKQLILVPRGFYKTTICSVAYPIWLLLRDPDTTILLASATVTLGQHVLREIKAVFERNALFRDVFRDRVPEDFTKTKWSETEIVIPRPTDGKEPSIQVIGVGGTIVGQHFRVALFDDLINEKHESSPDEMQKVIDWHEYAMSLLVEPAKDRELVVGTRWAFSDLYSRLIEQGQFALYERAAIENDQPTFPEQFPLADLREIEKRQGPYKFTSLYLNKPTDPARQVFRPEWAPEVPWSESLRDEVRDWTVYALVDPALSDKRDGSHTGYVLAAVGPGYRTVLLAGEKHRWTVGDLIARVFADADRFPDFVVGVEMVSLAKALKYPLDQEMSRRGKFLRLTVLQPDTRLSKEMRIRALQPYFANLLFRFVSGACDGVLRDIRDFPFGDGKYDALDALSYLPHLWTSAEIVTPRELRPEDDPLNMSHILRELRERGGGDRDTRFALHRAAYLGRN